MVGSFFDGFSCEAVDPSLISLVVWSTSPPPGPPALQRHRQIDINYDPQVLPPSNDIDINYDHNPNYEHVIYLRFYAKKNSSPLRAGAKLKFVFFPLTMWHFQFCDWDCLPDLVNGKMCRTEMENEKLFCRLQQVVGMSPSTSRRTNIMLTALPKLTTNVTAGEPGPVFRLRRLTVPPYGFGPAKMAVELTDNDGTLPSLHFSDRYLLLREVGHMGPG